jgi:hypothetical protein
MSITNTWTISDPDWSLGIPRFGGSDRQERVNDPEDIVSHSNTVISKENSRNNEDNAKVAASENNEIHVSQCLAMNDPKLR